MESERFRAQGTVSNFQLNYFKNRPSDTISKLLNFGELFINSLTLFPRYLIQLLRLLVKLCYDYSLQVISVSTNHANTM